MGDNKIKSLKELELMAQEPKTNMLEKEAKISDDKKSLLLRIPQEIRNKFGIKAGDSLRFSGEIKQGKGELTITWIQN